MRNFLFLPSQGASLPVLVLSALTLAGCAHTTKNPELPVGKAAYAVIPEQAPQETVYRVRALDTLRVRVLGEPDLSSDQALVSEMGNLEVPLIGSVAVAGKTVTEIGQDIAHRLGAKYLVDPEVSVSVTQMAPRYASVEGEVNKPGVYEINRDATLLSTIARASSPTSTAHLNEVVVFRTVNDQRMVARFDLKQIRTGLAPDPHIQDGDVIMIGYSTTRGFVEDILRAAPLFNAWAKYN